MSPSPPGHDGPPDGEFIDRRSGKDRRGTGERRVGGRRFQPKEVEEERRSGSDRRRGQRRKIKDRRRYNDPRYKKPRPQREGPSTYTADEIERVRVMLSRVGFPVACPVCDGRFTLGPVERRDAETVRQVTCTGCNRGTVVTNCVIARVMSITGAEVVGRALRKIMTDVGHEIVEPPNTDAALEVYRDNPADVVIVDAPTLGEREGQEFVRQLHKGFVDPKIVIVAPRASRGAVDPTAVATRLGPARVVRTPFTPEDILRAIKEARQ